MGWVAGRGIMVVEFNGGGKSWRGEELARWSYNSFILCQSKKLPLNLSFGRGQGGLSFTVKH
jgi:hypothetical protein